MTVTLYSWTPPTTHTSKYLLRSTLLNGPRTAPLPEDEGDDMPKWLTVPDACRGGGVMGRRRVAAQTLDDIDDWYSPQIEDDGFLERLDRSAEIVRFP